MNNEIPYTFTIRFANGVTKVKKMSCDKMTLPYLIMRLRSQYVKAYIDWKGADGSNGTTELPTTQITQ
jgi:hypothetical protein